LHNALKEQNGGKNGFIRSVLSDVYFKKIIADLDFLGGL
jgi:hypothetical protein